MTRLTVVVIGTGQIEPFESTLASVLQHRPPDCQVMAVFGGQYQDPYHIGGEVDLLSMPDSATRADLLNAALQAARAPVIHPLAAGMEVDENWWEPALPYFADSNVASVSPMSVDANDVRRVINFGVGYGAGGRRTEEGAGKRLRDNKPLTARIVGPSFLGGFYRLSALRRLGGFDPSIGDDLVDVDMGMALQRLGYRSIFEPASRLRGERRRTRGPRTLMAGLRQERLFLRYAGQLGWIRALLLHPLVVAAQSLSALPSGGAMTQLVGRAVAYFDLPAYLRFTRRMRTAQQSGSPSIESTTVPLRTDHPSLDRAA